jgi:hypothetical protein
MNIPRIGSIDAKLDSIIGSDRGHLTDVPHVGGLNVIQRKAA